VNEQHKLDEARYFLAKMGSTHAEPQHYSYNLSAFLAAARSTLQYALKEAQTKPGGQHWYDQLVASSPEASFLKDQRDVSIHAKPVVPVRHINVYDTISISVGDSALVTIKRADGSMENREVSLPHTQSAGGLQEYATSISYHLDGWPDSEDVDSLSARYLSFIEQLVVAGRGAGFLTAA
jgi:hypothetical protein